MDQYGHISIMEILETCDKHFQANIKHYFVWLKIDSASTSYFLKELFLSFKLQTHVIGFKVL